MAARGSRYRDIPTTSEHARTEHGSTPQVKVAAQILIFVLGGPFLMSFMISQNLDFR